MSDKKLHVFTNDEDFVIAHDEADARTAYEEHVGSADPDSMKWEQRDDSKSFTFFDNESITKTYGEWAAEKGRGYFASTDY